jgi:transposase
METRVENRRGRQWYKYSPEFKQAAVDRFVRGESAAAVAAELKIRRKFLYAWRDAGYGSNRAGARPQSEACHDEDPQQQQIAKQQQRIAELERLTGQQAAELDFFVAALRATKELRPNKDGNSGSGSTQRSKV